MLGKNAANPLRICEYFNETEPRSAPSKSGSDTHALLKPRRVEPTAVWTGKFPPHLRRDTRQYDYMTFATRRRCNDNLSRLNCKHFSREKERAI